jgi:hypothetical protein
MATTNNEAAPAAANGAQPEGMKRYIKGATLGEGTFGVVTKAEDTLTQKHVAIKKAGGWPLVTTFFCVKHRVLTASMVLPCNQPGTPGSDNPP